MLLKKDQPQTHYILCSKDSITLKILFGRMSLSTTANIGDTHSKLVATEIDSSRLLSTTSCLDSPTSFRPFVPIVSETSMCYVLNKSAATIQHQWRKRRELRRRKVEETRVQELAATTIQSSFRSFTIYQAQRHQYLSAVKVQNQWRQYSARTEFERSRASAPIIQTQWKYFALASVRRRQYESSVILQRWWRGLVARVDFEKKIIAVVTIQSFFRQRAVQREIKFTATAASTIQVWWRRRRALARQKDKLLLWNVSATTIQSNWRSLVYQRDRRIQLESLTQIQTASATKIQASWRLYRLRDSFVTTRMAVIKAQSLYRARHIRQQYHELNAATSIIQSWWRRVLLQLQHSYATRIQTIWRACMAKNHSRKQRASMNSLSDLTEEAGRGRVEGLIEIKEHVHTGRLPIPPRRGLSPASFAQHDDVDPGGPVGLETPGTHTGVAFDL